MDTWLNCDVELCPLIVHHDGVIEDAGCSECLMDVILEMATSFAV
jgi:hypothetical protein